MTYNNQLILTKTSNQWSGLDVFPSSDINHPLFIFNRDNNNIVYDNKEVAGKKN